MLSSRRMPLPRDSSTPLSHEVHSFRLSTRESGHARGAVKLRTPRGLKKPDAEEALPLPRHTGPVKPGQFTSRLEPPESLAREGKATGKVTAQSSPVTRRRTLEETRSTSRVPIPLREQPSLAGLGSPVSRASRVWQLQILSPRRFSEIGL